MPARKGVVGANHVGEWVVGANNVGEFIHRNSPTVGANHAGEFIRRYSPTGRRGGGANHAGA